MVMNLSASASSAAVEATGAPAMVRRTAELAQRCDERTCVTGLIGDAAMVEVEQVDRAVSGQEELAGLAVAVHDARRASRGNALKVCEETLGQAQQLISPLGVDGGDAQRPAPESVQFLLHRTHARADRRAAM